MLESSARPPILRHFYVGGSSAWPRRRFLELATPEAPQLSRVGGLSPPPRPSTSFGHPPPLEGPKVLSFSACSPPPVPQPLHLLSITKDVSALDLPRILRTYLNEGPLGEGYPPTLPGERMQTAPNT